MNVIRWHARRWHVLEVMYASKERGFVETDGHFLMIFTCHKMNSRLKSISHWREIRMISNLMTSCSSFWTLSSTECTMGCSKIRILHVFGILLLRNIFRSSSLCFNCLDNETKIRKLCLWRDQMCHSCSRSTIPRIANGCWDSMTKYHSWELLLSNCAKEGKSSF